MGACICDGFLKSPISALRCIPHHCGVRKVRLILRNLRRLELELFTLPSKADFLRDQHIKGEIYMQIEDKVKKLIAEKLDVDISDVVDGASLIDDLGADSLAIIELIMTMEEEFDIEVPDEDAEKLSTVKDAVNYIIENT
jgi:acyl carrier protein